MSPATRKLGLYIALGLLAALLGAWLAGRMQRLPVLQAGTWLPQPRTIPAFSLLNQSAALADSSVWSAAPSLVFFGFSNCPDVCPNTLALLKNLRARTLMNPLQVIMISIDPDRDSPQQLKRYLQGFDPAFIGLTGSPDQLKTLQSAFSVAVSRLNLPGGDYALDHSSAVYLVDRQGRIAAVFTAPLQLDALRADLDQLRQRIG